MENNNTNATVQERNFNFMVVNYLNDVASGAKSRYADFNEQERPNFYEIWDRIIELYNVSYGRPIEMDDIEELNTDKKCGKVLCHLCEELISVLRMLYMVSDTMPFSIEALDYWAERARNYWQITGAPRFGMDYTQIALLLQYTREGENFMLE